MVLLLGTPVLGAASFGIATEPGFGRLERGPLSGAPDTKIGVGSKRVRRAIAEIYEFPLRPTTRARNASGEGVLALAQSPFGVSLTVDGHVKYDIALTIRGLQPAERYGTEAAYVVWITTPTLEMSKKLGVLGNDMAFRGEVLGFNKFLIVISVENSPDVEMRSGPIVLRGRSPSGLIQSFLSHELFNNMPHE